VMSLRAVTETAVSTSSGRGETRDEEVPRVPRRRGPAPRGNDTPSPGVAPKSRDDDEVENPMEAMPISRESGCATVGRDPGAPTGRSARGRPGEAREGRWAGNSVHDLLEQEASKWPNPRRQRRGHLAKPQARVQDLRGVSIPEGEAKLARAQPNPEGSGAREGVPASRGDKPRRGTPGAEPG